MFPSPQTDEEEQCLEQGGEDPEITPFWVKRIREKDKVGLRKKPKAKKSSLDPINLTKGDLNDISDTVRDATTELL